MTDDEYFEYWDGQTDPVLEDILESLFEEEYQDEHSGN